jgi:hypothetical protein
VVEIDCRKLGLVEEGGYELARAGHVIAIPCKRVRKEEKKMPKMLFHCTAAHGHTTEHTKQNNSS